jgi:O-antigen/teichoic acid export membrane protein
MVKLNKSLLTSSIILLVSFNLFNAINFLFQFAMARMLTAADYGVMAALFSFIYLSGIFGEPIMTIIAKYSAGEKSKEKVKNLLKRSLKKSLKISSMIFLVFIFAAIPLSFMLNIPYLLLSSTGLMIFAAFLPPITRGVMQGKKMFSTLGINLVIESIVKIFLAVSLVFIGWKVYGAMLAAIAGAFTAFLFSLLALRSILKSREQHMNIPGFYSYSWPAFLMIFSVLCFFSLDIIIARIVFEATTAGYYAIASTLAKAIFLATQPISKALFPMAAEKKRGDRAHLLPNALGMILTCLVPALLVFYFFPDWLIRIFAGRFIIESQNILIYLAAAMGIFSIANLLLLYKLSIGKTKNYKIFVIFPIIELVLLCIFSHNLIEFSIAFLTASAIFLWGAVFLLDE